MRSKEENPSQERKSTVTITARRVIIKKECWKLKKKKKKQKSEEKQGDKNTIAITSDRDFIIFSDCEKSCLCLTYQDTNWVIDTGAPYYSTTHKDFFTSYRLGDFGVVKMENSSTTKL